MLFWYVLILILRVGVFELLYRNVSYTSKLNILIESSESILSSDAFYCLCHDTHSQLQINTFFKDGLGHVVSDVCPKWQDLIAFIGLTVFYDQANYLALYTWKSVNW